VIQIRKLAVSLGELISFLFTAQAYYQQAIVPDFRCRI
jgi:hypothetical protein